jgi:anti-sigma regulatory factor (Ser/Thr protein kinase)/CheY-like chemotaxis protein
MGSSPSGTGVVLVQTGDLRGASLREALSARPELAVVQEVSTPREAVVTAERFRPRVVVMDVGLAEIAGHGVLASIRAVAPDTRVVLQARAADVGEGPGAHRWTRHLVQVVLDPEGAGALEARLVLTHQPRSVTMARQFVADLLPQWGLERVVPESELLVSELVANAVRHVPAPCAVELSHHADLLRIAVADSGPGLPDLQALRPLSEGGRGLHLVSAFAAAWGVDQLDEGGKLVWAELDPVGIGAA